MVIRLLICVAVVVIVAVAAIRVKRAKSNNVVYCYNLDWAANRCSYLNAYDHTCMHPCSAACDYQMAGLRGEGDGFDGFK